MQKVYLLFFKKNIHSCNYLIPGAPVEVLSKFRNSFLTQKTSNNKDQSLDSVWLCDAYPRLTAKNWMPYVIDRSCQQIANRYVSLNKWKAITYLSQSCLQGVIGHSQHTSFSSSRLNCWDKWVLQMQLSLYREWTISRGETKFRLNVIFVGLIMLTCEQTTVLHSNNI